MKMRVRAALGPPPDGKGGGGDGGAAVGGPRGAPFVRSVKRRW